MFIVDANWSKNTLKITCIDDYVKKMCVVDQHSYVMLWPSSWPNYVIGTRSIEAGNR